MTPIMTLLRLDNVGKFYGGVAALRGLSFAVEAGEIVGLMGANGAGKTTAFSLIAGTQRPSGGQIWFDGRRIDGRPAYAAARLGIARTFQIVRPFAGLSVTDNVVIAALYGRERGRSRSAAEERAQAILAEVGLAREARRPAGTLTLAAQKRLEIARALATGPRLLLLDEVLAGLTASEVAEALDMIRALHRRYHLTLVVIEHVMRALMHLCRRIIVLHHGEKIAEGSPAQVMADQRVIDSYLGARKA
jgi:branched-chain amino acid transport system ATP-binding protein